MLRDVRRRAHLGEAGAGPGRVRRLEAPNNIVLADCKLPYIFIDPNGGEAYRFKMVEQVRGSGIRVGTSPDGLTWDLPDRLVCALKPDTPKQVYWDARIGRYVAWLKLIVADDGTPMFPSVDPIDSDPPVVALSLLRPGRSIGRIEVDDLTAPWPEEDIRTVLAADEHDPPESDILPPRRAALRRGRGRLLHVPDDLPAPR